MPGPEQTIKTVGSHNKLTWLPQPLDCAGAFAEQHTKGFVRSPHETKNLRAGLAF